MIKEILTKTSTFLKGAPSFICDCNCSYRKVTDLYGRGKNFCCFNEFDLHILLCVNNETYLILPMKGYTCYIEMNGLCTGTLCD